MMNNQRTNSNKKQPVALAPGALLIIQKSVINGNNNNIPSSMKVVDSFADAEMDSSLIIGRNKVMKI